MLKENGRKNIVQDVVPKGKTIRNVSLPQRRMPPVFGENSDIKTPAPKPVSRIGRESIPNATSDVIKKPLVQEKSQEKVQEKETPSYDYTYDEPTRSSRKLLWISLAIVGLVAALGVSVFFKSATITLTPRNETKALDEVFTAKKDAALTGLGFQVVTVSKDVESAVAAGAEQDVNTKARGTIVIYNNHSAEPQSLIATTRFETEDGVLFRLVSPVTVPGKKGNTPGSIEGTVEADLAGDASNIPLSDFTLPALKGTTKYKNMYARSKTVMSGGFSGKQKTISEDVLKAADTALEKQLRDSLVNDIATQIPENFVLFPADIAYDIQPATQVAAPTGTQGAMLRKKGSAQAVIFDKGALSRAIVAKLLPSEVEVPILVSNFEALTFEYVSEYTAGTDRNLSVAQEISFMLRGDAKMVWSFDEEKLKNDVLGLSKNDAENVIRKYPAIHEAWIETQPFWNQNIPKDSEKVTFVNTVSGENAPQE